MDNQVLNIIKAMHKRDLKNSDQSFYKIFNELEHLDPHVMYNKQNSEGTSAYKQKLNTLKTMMQENNVTYNM